MQSRMKHSVDGSHTTEHVAAMLKHEPQSMSWMVIQPLGGLLGLLPNLSASLMQEKKIWLAQVAPFVEDEHVAHCSHKV